MALVGRAAVDNLSPNCRIFVVEERGTQQGDELLERFVVGQRKGLGIGGLGEPLYVVRLDPETRRVIVGPKEALSTPKVALREINWLGDEAFDSRAEWHLNVKVRSTRPPRPAVIRPLSATEAEVELLDPEYGVSPGQACVFYAPEGSRIFGGGLIWRGRN